MKILVLDIGTGTQDILLFDSSRTIETCIKLVMPAPTVIAARRIREATRARQPLAITGVNMGGGPEGYEGTINERCVTVAEALREAGYATSMSGKWHLSGDHLHENESWPTSRGFDYYYGIITGAADYFAPQTLMHDHENVEQNALEDPDYYLTDAISDNAADQINRHFADHSHQPLFEYVAYTAPHWPLHAREEDI